MIMLLLFYYPALFFYNIPAFFVIPTVTCDGSVQDVFTDD